MSSTSRINWIVNIAIPDSIIMKMMDRNLASALPMPKVWSLEAGITSLYTLRILSTIKDITTAFAVKETEILVRYIVIPKEVSSTPRVLFGRATSGAVWIEPIVANQVAESVN